MKIQELARQIEQGHVTSLARAITLMESQKTEDWQLAKELLNTLKKTSATSTRRLGFSGPPGVGKSTFIEKLGLELVGRGDKVAVLAIDPSSEISGGSILGDKTRMEELSRHPMAFVRPSPTRGHLGGVTSRLPGVIQLCEAAGYQWILIESVGVGQSEVELSRMVDFFTMISQPGAGDELQGIKKGILEYVDLILVNKQDRDANLVNITRQQYLAALKILRGQNIEVLGCSALTGQGVAETLKVYDHFFKNYDFSKRHDVMLLWFESLMLSEFKKRLRSEAKIERVYKPLMQEVREGNLSPIEAVDHFFDKLKF